MKKITRATATHEAGHAIAEWRYGYRFYAVHAAPWKGEGIVPFRGLDERHV